MDTPGYRFESIRTSVGIFLDLGKSVYSRVLFSCIDRVEIIIFAPDRAKCRITVQCLARVLILTCI